MKVRPYFTTTEVYQAKGFSLMEMILVLGIIALIVGLGVTLFGDFGKTRKLQEAKIEIDRLATALASYELDNGSLPTSAQGLDALVTKPTVNPIPKHWRKYWTKDLLDPWSKAYVYRVPGQRSGKDYDLFSLGVNGTEDSDDIGNWEE